MPREPLKPSGEKEQDKSFADFLIGLGYFPLTVIGKGMKFFGKDRVLAFLAGALFVYVYTLFPSAPYYEFLLSRTISPKTTGTGTIRVRGIITGTAPQYARVFLVPEGYEMDTSDDGRYELHIPKVAQASYTGIALLAKTDGTRRIRIGTAEPDPDGGGLKFDEDLGNNQ